MVSSVSLESWGGMPQTTVFSCVNYCTARQMLSRVSSFEASRLSDANAVTSYHLTGELALAFTDLLYRVLSYLWPTTQLFVVLGDVRRSSVMTCCLTCGSNNLV